MLRTVPTTVLLTALLTSFALADDKVSFSRDIQPILSDKCYQCHGPDKNQRKSGLRLDTKEGAFAKRDAGQALVPGKPEASVLFERIASQDPDYQMPPAASGHVLSDAEKSLIKKWIEQGADWQDHWSFQPVVRPPLPAGITLAHPIDRFIHQRLKSIGIKPRGVADRRTLIRRLTFDLTGTPPTIAEVAAFVNDESTDAYERLVDRLLSSPRFGEHMAASWLDEARYADTSGYQNDGPRYMWRWRDWVIEAFNQNKPFDEFTVEQLAGDLLSKATLEQRIATGFNRNHRGNAEGGIIPEEYAVEYVVDRVETTGAVWLGLTIGCARCHDHKFDPVSQKEFYQLYSLFNNVPENGRAIKEGNSPPYIKAPTRLQLEQLQQLAAEVKRARSDLADLAESADRSLEVWAATAEIDDPEWSIREGQVLSLPFRTSLSAADGKVDASFSAGSPSTSGPRLGDGLQLDGKRHVEVKGKADFGYFDQFSIAAWIKPESPTGTVVSRMVPERQGAGYYLHLQDGKLQVNLVKRWLDDSIRVETKNPIAMNKWQHVVMVYDGSRVASGIRVLVNNVPQELVTKLDGINQTFAVDEPVRIGGGSDGFTGSIADVRVFDRALQAKEVSILSTSATIPEILAITKSKRTSNEAAKLREFFLREAAPPAVSTAYNALLKAEKAYAAFEESVPTVMVMEDIVPRRQAYVLKRGQYDQPGEAVSPGLPLSLRGAADAKTPTRLEFARWLVSRQNPLTARVRVNRIWQRLFGSGLVATSEDFGVQGSRPSHPELLDWLAAEFMESGWNQKQLIRLMVTSDAYQRSAQIDPAAFAKDPANRWLWRGPRVRLSAEMIRDQALAVSGLLDLSVGGPSVKPYQPAGLWKEIATVTDYDRSEGADLYRRSLYTFWKRTVAPPSMVAFDATAREVCTVARSRTNTPLQALTLLNEEAFVETARVLAERLLSANLTEAERIERMFEMVTSRTPNEVEAKILTKALQDHLSYYRKNLAAANKLIRHGEAPLVYTYDPAELAAYTAVANTILNLDETIYKP